LWFYFSFSLKNYGFSTLHNSRKVYVVFLDPEAGEIMFQWELKTANTQTWQPHRFGDPKFLRTLHTVEEKFVLLDGIPFEEYYIGIFLPDPHMQVPHKAAFSIRFANEDVGWWVDKSGNYGVNVLGEVRVAKTTFEFMENQIDFYQFSKTRFLMFGAVTLTILCYVLYWRYN